ncbi:barstar family protein [Sphingomonas sp. LT1P40]|uniref:barstar family protein n=1 Tax=Alteristakelama amylovorans TaxID=3096166 RepID=UPI002FC9619E
MQTIYIDCTGVVSTQEFWQRYLNAVQPESADFFGRNLDAFWDAIEGGGPGWPGEVKLSFTNTSHLSALRLDSGVSFLGELQRIASETTQTEIELV